MYFRQIFTNEKIGLVYLIILGAVYNLSIVTLTVGFFTPYWLHGLDYYWGYGYYDDNNGTWGYWNHDVNIDTAGLISGEFRYPYSRKFDPSDIYGAYTYYVWQEDDNRRNIANDTKRTFYLTVTTMCILYSNLIMALAAFIFKLSDNRIYMSLLSLSFGTLYPLGAISILIATIALELEYKSEVGFSTVLGTVSGGFMLLFYSGLRFYNYQYIKHLIQIEKENTSESIGKASWGKEKAQAGVGHKYE